MKTVFYWLDSRQVHAALIYCYVCFFVSHKFTAKAAKMQYQQKKKNTNPKAKQKSSWKDEETFGSLIGIESYLDLCQWNESIWIDHHCV